jgi:hypothetical protein
MADRRAMYFPSGKMDIGFRIKAVAFSLTPKPECATFNMGLQPLNRLSMFEVGFS